MEEFLQLADWRDSHEFLRAHPELLDEEIDARLQRRVDTLEKNGMVVSARFVDEHRCLLAHCREVGVDRAFAEKESRSTDYGTKSLMRALAAVQDFVERDTWQGSRIALDAHPELLDADIDLLFGEIIASAGNDTVTADRLAEHRRLLARCREAGVAQAFSERTADSTDELAETVWSFINASTDQAAATVIEAHPELLGDAARALLLDRMATAAHTSTGRDAMPFLEDQLRLLDHYRESVATSASSGIAVAASLEPRPSEIDDLQEAIWEFLGAPNWIERSKVVRAHPKLLSRTVGSFLGDLATEARAEDPSIADRLGLCREVLACARRVGFEQAVALTGANEQDGGG